MRSRLMEKKDGDIYIFIKFLNKYIKNVKLYLHNNFIYSLYNTCYFSLICYYSTSKNNHLLSRNFFKIHLRSGKIR